MRDLGHPILADYGVGLLTLGFRPGKQPDGYVSRSRLNRQYALRRIPLHRAAFDGLRDAPSPLKTFDRAGVEFLIAYFCRAVSDVPNHRRSPEQMVLILRS